MVEKKKKKAEDYSTQFPPGSSFVYLWFTYARHVNGAWGLGAEVLGCQDQLCLKVQRVKLGVLGGPTW